MTTPSATTLPCEPKLPDAPLTVLELTVQNHPGVMTHVCGLFARRGFNVEAILCVPVGDGSVSRIRLIVPDDERLPQVLAQTAKLEDVVEIHQRNGLAELFAGLSACLRTA